MEAIHFVFCLCTVVIPSAFSSLATEEGFKIFLQKFTSSASLQYSRVEFPLRSPIILLRDDRETEQTFPFTHDKQALLGSETLRRGRIMGKKGGTCISHLTQSGPVHKEFETGYDESEPSLRVVFGLISSKWYVTDCYNDWYNSDLPVDKLEETVRTMQEGNKAFEGLHP